MKIRIANSKRIPSWPMWAVSITLAWLAFIGIAVYLSKRTNMHVELCLFKRITSIPCPTCGLTRGTLALLDGNIESFWLYNPLMFLLISLFFIHTGFRIMSSRTIHIHLSKKERLVMWGIAVTVLVTNWIYLISFIG